MFKFWYGATMLSLESQRVIGQFSCRKGARDSSRYEQCVALANRNVQRFGQPQDELSTWAGTTGFDERHVPRRRPGLRSKVELCHSDSVAPMPQLLAKWA